MKGRYESGEAPQAEHQIARRLDWEGPLATAKLIGAALVLACGAITMHLQDGSLRDLCGAGWRIGAAMLLCAAGRTAMISWMRWSRRIPSVSSFLGHRFRRLAPVHLISLAIVAGTVSTYSLMGMPEQADGTGLALNIVPIWPNVFAAENNPSWFILQAVIIGSILTPVVSVIGGGPMRVVGMAIVLAAGSLVPGGTIWSVPSFLVAAFLMGSLTDRVSGIGSMTRMLVLIGAMVMMSAGQAMGEFDDLASLGSMTTAGGAAMLLLVLPAIPALRMGSRCSDYLYPAIMLTYPIIRFGAIAGGAIVSVASVLFAAMIVWLTARLLERPNAKAVLQRAMNEESGRKALSEHRFELPYHPENDDTP